MRQGSARMVTDHFTILWRPAPGRGSRLGVTVTKRVASAVGRNRVKRMVREAYRRWPDRNRRPWDIVVIARAGAPALGGAEVARQLTAAFRRMQGGPEK